MIKFDLVCENEHVFEAIFDDSVSFEKQRKKKQIECPFCNSSIISKSVMAPNVANKSTSSSKINRKKNKIFSIYNKQLDKIKSEIEKNFTYVGKKFPEEARKIYYGEAKDKPIYGEASEKESKELIDEGIELIQLPFKQNEKKKN